MPTNRPRRPKTDLDALAKPSRDTKQRRDTIRARWRAVIVEDFGTISAFRSAWPATTPGQQTAETVYGFLQQQARSKDDERHADLKLSTVFAFAEMTRRSVGFLLTGLGSERDGVSRERRELADDVSTALTDAVPESLRKHGFRIDGLMALAFLWIKIQNISKALAPLVEIGSEISQSWAPLGGRRKILSAIEAASGNVTADCPGLLALDVEPFLREAIRVRGTSRKNPAIKPIVDAMLSLARAKAEKSGITDLLTAAASDEVSL